MSPAATEGALREGVGGIFWAAASTLRPHTRALFLAQPLNAAQGNWATQAATGLPRAPNRSPQPPSRPPCREPEDPPEHFACGAALSGLSNAVLLNKIADRLQSTPTGSSSVTLKPLVTLQPCRGH